MLSLHACQLSLCLNLVELKLELHSFRKISLVVLAELLIGASLQNYTEVISVVFCLDMASRILRESQIVEVLDLVLGDKLSHVFLRSHQILLEEVPLDAVDPSKDAPLPVDCLNVAVKNSSRATIFPVYLNKAIDELRLVDPVVGAKVLEQDVDIVHLAGHLYNLL